MANFNRIILIGRLTRDPEVRTFANGGKVAKFGFAASPNQKKNQQTGQWEDEPMYVDVEAFNRGDNGTLANRVEQFLRKGSLICIEGKLHLEQWDDKTTGQKRSKHKIVVDNFTFLESKAEAEARRSGGGNSGSGEGGGYSKPSRPAADTGGNGYSPPPDDMMDEPAPSSGGSGEEIPF